MKTFYINVKNNEFCSFRINCDWYEESLTDYYFVLSGKVVCSIDKFSVASIEEFKELKEA